MKKHQVVFTLLFAFVTILTAIGCSRDPNVRKQKYFESGNRYFAQEKYQEAAIQYQNAIQVDGRFADAHYKLAKTYIKLQAWRTAFGELRRAVDLRPDNLEAQTD